MPSASVRTFESTVLVIEGICEGFVNVLEGFGGLTCDGRGRVAGVRALRISRSSKSSSRSSMSPSDGSLSKSLSLTSSIRACDMVIVVLELEDGGAWWGWI